MTQPIKCACGALFGIQQEDGSLAIKYRDLFRTVRGSVSGPCRKCGAEVYWSQAPSWTPLPPAFPSTAPFTCNCACTVCMSGSCCWNNVNSIHWRITSTDTTNDG